MAISPQRLTIYLCSAHRAVIFAIAQLSCLTCVHFSGAACWCWQRPTLAPGSQSPYICVYSVSVVKRPVAGVGSVTPLMSFLDYLQNSTDVFKSSRILNRCTCTICHSVCRWRRKRFRRSPDGGIWFAVWHHSEAVSFQRKVSEIIAMFGTTYVCE